MKIKVHNKELYIAIVYSAYHTGTWFNVNLLGTSKEGVKRLGRSDEWSRKYTGKVLESNKIKELNREWLHNILLKAPKDFYNMNLLILQAHHVCGRSSPMYKALKNQKNRGIPIIVPIRDALLAINSKLWRAYSTEKIFKKQTKGYRLSFTQRHISEIKDLLILSKDSVIFSPIDLELRKKKQQVYNILKRAGLTPSRNTDKVIREWKPINSTPQYLKNQKRQSCNFFKEMKYAILNKDLKHIKKHYNTELEILQKDKDLKNLYKSFNYKELLWY